VLEENVLRHALRNPQNNAKRKLRAVARAKNV